MALVFNDLPSAEETSANNLSIQITSLTCCINEI